MLIRRIFVIGDSISIGYGPFLRKFLPGTLAYDRKRGPGSPLNETGLPVDGENAGDSAMLLAYLRGDPAQLPRRGDMVIFNCGLHDIKRPGLGGRIAVGPSEYVRNLQAIVGKLIELGVAPVWVQTTPVIDRIHLERCTHFVRRERDVLRYNQLAGEVMVALGIPVLDLHSVTALALPSGVVDHVHFDEPTRWRQAAFIAGGVAGLLQSLPERKSRNRRRPKNHSLYDRN